MNREYLLEWCKKYTNNNSLQDVGDFHLVMNELVKEFDRIGISSESVSNVSFSYGGGSINIKILLDPYRKLKRL